MKRYWALAVGAFVCLAYAALWLGGLNQDEGWYLYAANLVHEGQRVYRDFAFTQGPLMPAIYSWFTWVWDCGGLLGARLLTLAFGVAGMAFAAWCAYRMASEGSKGKAALIVVFLLGCNLYHLYYLAIPKTYALAGLFVMAGMMAALTALSSKPRAHAFLALLLGGGLLGMAAGCRISLVMLALPFAAVLLFRRAWLPFAGFCLGGALGVGLTYGFVLFDAATFRGFLAAQAYHAARKGFDLTWAVGSLSRLVRWYLPVFIVLGLAIGRRGFKWVPTSGLLLAAFLCVFVVQMLAPFPYEDYQVPIMALLAVFAAVNFASPAAVSSKPPCLAQAPQTAQTSSTKHQTPCTHLLLVLGLTFANSFGSPLLQEWMTNGQDRFWSRKKSACEMAQLRDAARRIEQLDPGGKELFTQDLYLAIETRRKVPRGLEMGPFSQLTDAEWRRVISTSTATIAAISGYTFAIEPPACTERPIEQQFEYFNLLKERYLAVDSMADFGQNATTLLILKRNGK